MTSTPFVQSVDGVVGGEQAVLHFEEYIVLPEGGNGEPK